VLAITIQENRSSRFSSLIVDWDGERILPNYPMEVLRKYDKLRVGKFNVAYASRLALQSLAEPSNLSLCSDKPFCCGEIIPYMPRRLSADPMFNAFLRAKGHYPHVVYEVKEQVDNGPLLSTKYYTLINDRLSEIEDQRFTQKMHAFKITSVPSTTASGPSTSIHRESNEALSQAGYNYQHMRLNPFTKCDAALLDDFFPA
jgi:hypothetical protein